MVFLLRLVLVFVLVAGGCAGRQPVRTSDAVYRQVPIGLCEDYPEESSSEQLVREDLGRLKEAGIKHLRISLGWDSIEPEDGRFHWTFWDRFIALAADEYGIELHPYVCYTPTWNSSGKENYWNEPPRDLNRFRDFVSLLVARYRDRIHTWELWNEPDNPAFWSGTEEQYAALVRVGAEAVRRADPGARVVLGGLAWNLEYLKSLLEKHRLAASVDVVNLHMYPETWTSEQLERLADYVRRARALAVSLGEGEPLWLAETGYSSFRKGAYVSDQYRAVYGYEHTEAFQALALQRMLAVALSTERLELIAWYEMRDLEASAEVIGDVNNRHLGVRRAGGAAKPAWSSLAAFRSLFAGPVRSLDRELQVLRPVSAESEIHCFERRDGSVIVLGWLRTADPGRIPVGEGNAADLRVERALIQLPFRRGSLVRRAPDGSASPPVPVTENLELLLRGGENWIGEVFPRP